MKESTNILRGPDYLFVFPEKMTVGQLMHNQLETHGTKIAQIQKETGEERTYKDILIRSQKLAVYLRNHGIKVNDRIAICSENNLGWAVSICATIFVGATVCPLNPMYSQREFLHTINISKPKLIFVSPLVLKSVKNYVKELSWTPTIILMLEEPNVDVPSIGKLISNVPTKNIENFQVTNVNVTEHVVSILCSSGTTGMPKGVMLTDKNYLSTIQTMLDGSVGIAMQDQTIICLLPFFHAYCFSVLIFSIIAGSTAIVFSTFKEEAFLETIEKYKTQVLSLVPPLMVFLAKHPIVDNYDLSSVKIIWCGAAPLSREIEDAVKKRLNNPEIRQGYGMTETTLTVVKVPENCDKPGSAGRLMPGVLGKVIPIDDGGKWSDKTLGPYQEGELCFKGDLIMKGYCGDKTSTSATIDEEGWLHTGDVGYYDDDGFFYIVDRLKELIKYKGFQVPPAELEAILLTHPEIKDAAVVGLPDEVAGELPIAFVVKQPNAKVTADAVLKYVNGRLYNESQIRKNFEEEYGFYKIFQRIHREKFYAENCGNC
ncbi:hypothetical protein TSAR_003795 [Trichomalopsis sarcophagae]|uniref:Luciferin 4-monooxygenase n=1 Tax=Trichomalopsis sarcophagae TaxID=543379 RepID=A0A232FI37_9HYME|nr:hypothetical protein TSAR_003795 [Trichomalopsis sarcophagae]